MAKFLLLVFSALFAAGAAGQVPAVSAGADHSFAVGTDGRLLGWGRDDAGQLGLGTVRQSSTPLPVAGTFAAIATGASHTLALTASGDLYAWGSNAFGQLGDGTTSDRGAPVFIGAGFSAIAAGGDHSVALKKNGDLYGWGSNDQGQIGDGTRVIRLTPAFAAGGFVAIAAGDKHTVALKGNGSVWAWGDNTRGQLGDGTTSARFSPTGAISVGPYQAICARSANTCALDTAGNLFVWGDNSVGQVGDGTTTDRANPTLVGANFKLAVTGTTSAAIKTNGDLYTWGLNYYGELGDGTTTNRLVPTFVASGFKFVSVASGFSTFGITTAGDLYAWGWNGDGELGDGTKTDRSVPTFIGSGFSAVAVGYIHTVAMKSDGSVFAWGDNAVGQLGVGGLLRQTPTLVGSGFQAVAANRFATPLGHTVAVKANGDLYAWGNNDSGQLGDGGVTPRVSLPELIASGYRTAAVGTRHTVALKTNGDLFAWGSNERGQLGIGSHADRLAPVFVGSSFQAVAAGALHTVALKTNGDLYAWGANDVGQLGDGTIVDRTSPTLIGSGFAAIAAGRFHTIGIKNGGDLYTWGAGQLTPKLVSAGYAAAAAGNGFTIALQTNGDVYAWGVNGEGQLGDGSRVDRVGPSFVGSGFEAVAAGDAHALAVKRDGTMRAWGRNDRNQVGDGTFVLRLAPSVVLRENGAGTREGNDWFLTLKSGGPVTIPGDSTPAFLLVASGSVTSATANSVSADVRFKPADAGKPIYVFGFVPASVAKSGEKDGGCVLAQLTQQGVPQQVSPSSMVSSLNVAGTAHQTVNVVSNTVAANLAGSTFCIGAATAPAAAVDPANSACVATIPTTGPVLCLPDAAALSAPGALTGVFFNAGESGWGVHFTQRGPNIFVAWFAYDASGNPKWYTSTCTGIAGASGTCAGSLYQVTGPNFFATPFNPSLVRVAVAGSLQVTFTNSNSASMTTTVGTITRTVAITRQPLASGTTPPPTDYTDMWWGGPNESGWGIAITQQFNTVFIAWFVYDNANPGNPTWLVATCTLSGTTCTGPVMRTHGPPFGPTFDPSQVSSSTVGSITVTFTGANNGVLSYTVDGVSGTKNITRQLF